MRSRLLLFVLVGCGTANAPEPQVLIVGAPRPDTGNAASMRGSSLKDADGELSVPADDTGQSAFRDASLAADALR